jgi:tetratricopeptide (TPR) repeat protein
MYTILSPYLGFYSSDSRRFFNPKATVPITVLLECAAMSDIQTNAEGTKRRTGRLLGIGALVGLIGLGAAVIVVYVQAFLHFRSGVRDLERHHNAEARTHFQAYLRTWPKDPQALLLSARASWRLQDFEEAERYLQKYQQAGGEGEDLDRESLLLAASRGDIDRAVKYFQDEQQRPDAALPLILEALVSGCLRQDRFSEGNAFLQRWLELQPNDSQALLFQAGFTRLWKTPQDAIAEYRRLLELDPELDAARLPLASILVEVRQYEEAIPLLERVRQRQPNNLQALILLAQCQDFLGQQEAAEQLVNQVLAQAPDHTGALAMRGQLALHAGQFSAAETWLRQVLAREPSNYRVSYLLAECLLQQGRVDEVHKQLQQLKQLEADQKRLLVLTQEISKKPHDPSLDRELAMILLRRGNAEGGLRCLLSALREDPSSVLLRQALAEYQQNMGNKERPVSGRPFATPEAAVNVQKRP